MRWWLAAALILAIPGPITPTEDRVLQLDDGTELRYGIHLPAGAGDQPRPLIVGLHYAWGGGARPPAYYGRDYMNLLVRPALEELGAVIVAPDCPGRGWADPRSDAAVLALIESVRAELPIDPEKILVTGYSMGGMGTWSFVAHHPGLVSAAIPMAGRPTREQLDGWSGTPVYAIHSRADEVVPIAPTEGAIEQLVSRGVEAELHAVDGISHYQTGRFVGSLRGSVGWVRRIWAGQRPRLP